MITITVRHEKKILHISYYAHSCCSSTGRPYDLGPCSAKQAESKNPYSYPREVEIWI